MRGVAANIHHLAIEDVLHRLAIADYFRTVPFTHRILHVLFAAESGHILPLGIAAVPIEPAPVARDRLAPLLPVQFAVRRLADFHRHGRLTLAADQNEVASPAFDHLRFD